MAAARGVESRLGVRGVRHHLEESVCAKGGGGRRGVGVRAPSRYREQNGNGGCVRRPDRRLDDAMADPRTPEERLRPVDVRPRSFKRLFCLNIAIEHDRLTWVRSDSELRIAFLI